MVNAAASSSTATGMRPVVTRFAPSPTGYLHIGGARTALFNWLFARANDGRFLLRIEDTDRARSTEDATRAIVEGLSWLGLDWDGKAISQAANADRHAQVARAMLDAGTAYRCFATQVEIQAFRDAAQAEGRSTLFRSPWRDADPATWPDRPYAVRVKAPREGETVIDDAVQGRVTIRNDQLDDMIVLRSDGTPVYMLAVVVDDHDMGVTHVIRGDDHLNNAARQLLIWRAMGWDEPVWAHIPLIHGEDGKKLSKRHGALGVEEYRAMGYPAAALRNYLARLGWSHGDDEFFTIDQAVEWFGLDGIGRAPARLDFKKLDNLSRRHIAAMSTDEVLAGVADFLAATGQPALTAPQAKALRAAVPLLTGARTWPDLLEKARFALIDGPVIPDDKAAKVLDDKGRALLDELTPHLQNASWTRDELEAEIARQAEKRDLGLGQIAAPLRAALVGRMATPSVFDMMIVLGRDETLARLRMAAGTCRADPVQK
ncbi:glutamyl-tRNA synthetase [Oceaniovalibus guishaninsula JLT2003]|uniref:Glutamate--tRNA ligase n=1 Tax=Oceaniovalibus guishaninsula JLT2003 TaxID=1231392 RepID=K2GLV6_9RHOB|nr:glutamate--tRNA ligase [Oceaniovalibus guishaninsula]EKE43681.1 glutamyl-tRNA synthetase [Oceaniovalibus guishaninsula JLT2003]